MGKSKDKASLPALRTNWWPDSKHSGEYTYRWRSGLRWYTSRIAALPDGAWYARDGASGYVTYHATAEAAMIWAEPSAIPAPFAPPID